MTLYPSGRFEEPSIAPAGPDSHTDALAAGRTSTLVGGGGSVSINTTVDVAAPPEDRNPWPPHHRRSAIPRRRIGRLTALWSRGTAQLKNVVRAWHRCIYRQPNTRHCKRHIPPFALLRNGRYCDRNRNRRSDMVQNGTISGSPMRRGSNPCNRFVLPNHPQKFPCSTICRLLLRETVWRSRKRLMLRGITRHCTMPALT